MWGRKLVLFTFSFISMSFLLGGGLVNQGYFTIATGSIGGFASDFDSQNKRWLIIYREGNDIKFMFQYLSNLVTDLLPVTIPNKPQAENFSLVFGCYSGTCKYGFSFEYGSYTTFAVLDQNANLLNQYQIPVESKNPKVAFDNEHGGFLVVFEYSDDISGALFDFEGNFLKYITISSAQGEQKNPSVAYGQGHYLVVWEDKRVDIAGDLYFQVLDYQGNTLGDNAAALFVPNMSEEKPKVLFYGGNFLIFHINSFYCDGVPLDPAVVASKKICIQKILIPSFTPVFPQYLMFFPGLEDFYVAPVSDSYFAISFKADNSLNLVIAESDFSLLGTPPTLWFPSNFENCSENEEDSYAFVVSGSIGVFFLPRANYPGITTGLLLFSFPGNLSYLNFDAFPIKITTSELPNAVTGRAYPDPYTFQYPTEPNNYFPIFATGGSGSYRWYAVWGELPSGLTLSSDGKIYGIVSSSALSRCGGDYPCPYTFSVFVHDFSSPISKTACRKMTMKVFPFPKPDIVISPNPVIICVRPEEVFSQDIQVINQGSIAYLAIEYPPGLSPAKTFPSVCTTGREDNGPFHVEILTSSVYVDYDEFSAVATDDTTCWWKVGNWKTDSFTFSLKVTFISDIQGRFNQKITFVIFEPIVKRFDDKKYTIEITAEISEPDIAVSSESGIFPSNCSYFSYITTCVVDLGDVPVEFSKTVSINILNIPPFDTAFCASAAYPILISNIYSPLPPFYLIFPKPNISGVAKVNTSIPAGLTYPVQVSFAPSDSGDFEGYLVVENNDVDEGELYIKLRGRGVRPDIEIVPEQINCGTAIKGVSKPCGSIKVKNKSPYNLRISRVTRVGSSFFSIFPSPPINVSPNSEVSLNVNFSPSATGIFSATFSIYSNANTGVVSFNVFGEALEYGRIFSIYPRYVDFGEVILGNVQRRVVSVSNLSSMVGFWVRIDEPNLPFYSGQVSFFVEPKGTAEFDLFALPTTRGNFSSNLSLRFQDEFQTINFEENLTLYVKGVTPEVKIIPDGLDFGSVKVGDTKTGVIGVANFGDYQLLITGIKMSSNFSSGVSFPISIPPLTSSNFILIFSPKVEGKVEEGAVIYSNAGTYVISLTGIGVSEKVENAPSIKVEPREIDFGKVRLGRSEKRYFAISNVGAETLFVSSVSSLSESFKVILPLSLPLRLNYGDSVSVSVEFQPDSEKDFSSSIQIVSNSVSNPQIGVLVHGVGAEPHIFVDEIIDFGGVKVGKTVKKQLIVRNIGSFPLSVSDIVLSGSDVFFVSNPGSFIVSENQSYSIEVSFTPSDFESYEAELILYSDDITKNVVKVKLLGKGGMPVIVVPEKIIRFKTIFYDERDSYLLPVSNIGSAASDVFLKGPHLPVFSASQTYFSVPPQSSYSLELVFAPSYISGLFSDKVTIFTEDPKLPEFELEIYGEARRFLFKPAGGGCSCSSSSPVDLIQFPVLLILIAFWLRRKKLFILTFSFLIFSSFLSKTLYSQISQDSEIRSDSFKIDLQNFKHQQDIASFSFLRVGNVRPRGTFGLTVFSGFTEAPLRLKILKGSKEISSQMLIPNFFSAGFIISAVPLNNLEVSVGVPSAFFKSSFVLSDIYLEAKFNLINYKSFNLSLLPYMSFPTGKAPFSYGVIIPKISLLPTYELKSGSFKVVFAGEIGIRYIPDVRVGDVLLTSGSTLGLGLSLSYLGFSLAPEVFSILPFRELTKETVPAEFFFSVGYKFLPVFLFRIGTGFGISEGIGSPRFRVFSLATYEIKPLEKPKRKLIFGEVKDKDTGEPISEGLVVVDNAGSFAEVKDGKFQVYLPSSEERRKYTFSAFSPGYKTVRAEFSESDKIEIFMEKIQPRLALNFVDRLGISTEGEVKVRYEDKYFLLRTKSKVFTEPGHYTFEIADLKKDIYLSDKEIAWINILYSNPQFEEREQKQLATKSDVKSRKGKTDKSKDSKKVEKKGKSFESEVEKEQKQARQEIARYEEPSEKKSDDLVSSEESSKEVFQTGGERGVQKKSTSGGETEQPEKDVTVSVGSGVIYEPIGKEKSGHSEAQKARREKEISSETVNPEELKNAPEYIPGEKTFPGPAQKGVLSSSKKFYQKEVLSSEKENFEAGEKEVSKYIYHELKSPPKAEEVEEKITSLFEKVLDSFQVNRWDIPSASLPMLDEIAKTINENLDKIKKISIFGHADITGPEDWNIELSYLRALEIRKYLLKKGVRIPIELVGFGSSVPIAPNDTPEGRRKNRRIEIKIYFSGE